MSKQLQNFLISNKQHLPIWTTPEILASSGVIYIVVKDNENKICIQPQTKPVLDTQEIVGIFSMDKEKFKNLFIAPAHRNKGYASEVFNLVKQITPYITVAVATENSKIKNIVTQHGYTSTNKFFQGKAYTLEIFEWKAKSFFD